MRITDTTKNKKNEEKCMVICLECNIGFIQYISDKIMYCKKCGKSLDKFDMKKSFSESLGYYLFGV